MYEITANSWLCGTVLGHLLPVVVLGSGHWSHFIDTWVHLYLEGFEAHRHLGDKLNGTQETSGLG